MAEFSQWTVDAIDAVVDEKAPKSEWDPDAMRAALLDVVRGKDQQDAADGRGFTQPTLSKVLKAVEERERELRQEAGESTGLFRDPMEEAVGEFRDFFDRLNENYEMGIKDVAVRMMVDEIKDARQLPNPQYVHNFLEDANSGIANDRELSYVSRRYSNFLSNLREEMRQSGSDVPVAGSGGMGGGFGGGGPGGMGGPRIEGGGGGFQNGGQGGGGFGGGNGGYQQAGPRGQPGQPGPRGHGAGGQQAPPARGGRGDDGPSEEVQELREQVEALTEMVKGQQEDDGETEMITIQQDDGSQISLPADDPRVSELLSEDQPSMMDMMRNMKEAGLIVTPQDLQNQGDDRAMAEEISQAIESLGQQQVQAQQQMSANFKEALDAMRQMEEEEDDLSLEEVEEVIESKLSKSETERLREEMDEKFSEVLERVEDSRRRSHTGQQDPDYLKTDRKMEYQEKQLETINENLREIPEAVARSVREVVPAMKEIQFSQGQGNALWQPPGEAQRGSPGYVPKDFAGEEEPQEQAEQRRREQAEQRRREQQQQSGYPESEPQQATPEPEQERQVAEDRPEGVSEEEATEVREKLGLEGDGDTPEVSA